MKSILVAISIIVATSNVAFAVSIRGISQACAVWAQKADVDLVRSFFESIVLGVKPPGLLVIKDIDQDVPPPKEDTHNLIYRVRGEHNEGNLGYELTLLNTKKSDSPAQASIQVVPVRND